MERKMATAYINTIQLRSARLDLNAGATLLVGLLGLSITFALAQFGWALNLFEQASMW
jgi:hypothetical protein